MKVESYGLKQGLSASSDNLLSVNKFLEQRKRPSQLMLKESAPIIQAIS